MNVNCVIDE